VFRGNRRLTVPEVADEVDISIGSCHQIFVFSVFYCTGFNVFYQSYKSILINGLTKTKNKIKGANAVSSLT